MLYCSSRERTPTCRPLLSLVRCLPPPPPACSRCCCSRCCCCYGLQNPKVNGSAAGAAQGSLGVSVLNAWASLLPLLGGGRLPETFRNTGTQSVPFCDTVSTSKSPMLAPLLIPWTTPSFSTPSPLNSSLGRLTARKHQTPWYASRRSCTIPADSRAACLTSTLAAIPETLERL